MMPAPRTISDHAVDRYIERWVGRQRGSVQVRTHYTMRLTMALREAVHVEDLLDENQSVWSVFLGDSSDYEDWQPDTLLVVDANGVVRTVLPPGATRPAGRRRAR